MVESNEQKIIQQYQTLIRSLIQYQQENRLLEGLNRFSSRLPSHVRKIIRDEVIRLTSLTDAPADNSAFAQFPVFKFKHFGVQMRLDKVGASILQTESALYQDRYTVGVFETITNSEYYQAQIKKDNYKKIVDAFAIESQSLDDIHFGDDIAVAPNFPVSCLEFEKGRNCAISALAYQSMSLETKRLPKASEGEEFVFQFPDAPGLPSGFKACFVLDTVKFNPQTEKYESHFQLHPKTNPKLIKALEKYIDSAMFQQPLKRELEMERAMQDLDRDRIMEFSPWVPVFLSKNKHEYLPQIALLTATNLDQNGGFSFLESIASKPLFPRLITELRRYGESFVFRGILQTKRGDIQIAATHRELEQHDLLGPAIHLMVRAKKIQCTQCRLDSISRDDKDKAFAIHDLVHSEYASLSAITDVMFCKDVSSVVATLSLTEKRALPPVPPELMDTGEQLRVDFVMEESLDRRAESRYIVDKAATIRLGLMKTLNARVKDISNTGLRIVLDEDSTFATKEVKVSVPDLKIKNQKYTIVNHEESTRTLRMQLVVKGAQMDTSGNALIESNQAYFKSRDITLIQRNTHRFIWELAVRHHPSASILCTTNRYLLSRLKTLYQNAHSSDMYPFSQVENLAPLHGFFADRSAEKPKSKLLADMLKGEVTTTSVTHCVRRADNKLVFLPERDFFYTTLRKQVLSQLEEQKVELCVTRLEASRCLCAATPLTKKRLAQLSRIDKGSYEKFTHMQGSYTHVLYLTNESVLHNALLNAKLKPIRVKSAEALPAES